MPFIWSQNSYSWNRKEERKQDLTEDSKKGGKRTEKSYFNGTKVAGRGGQMCVHVCGLKSGRRHRSNEMMKCFLRGFQPFM